MNPINRLARICIASSSLLALSSNLHAQIEHGTLDVTANGDSPTVFLKEASSQSVTIEKVNRGDYHLNFSRSKAYEVGALLTTVNEIGGADTTHASSSVDFINNNADPLDLEYYISVRASPSGAQTDIDVSFALFPYGEYTAGYAWNGSNNATVGNLRGSAFEDGATLTDSGSTAGIYTLKLKGVDANYTSDKGVLLVTGGRNDDNFALSRAENNGTFTVWVKDNGADNDLFENDGFTFVYLPIDQDFEQIPAYGRVMADGSKILSKGDFTVQKSPTRGYWFLTIPGHSPDTGTLIISPEGGEGRNLDNVWSAEFDESYGQWVIESRDIEPENTNRQDIIDEPIFNFAFVAKAPVYVDADATGANDGSSWENAYTSLWTATQNATAGDQIWVAEGTYSHSDIAENDHSIELKSHVKLYGGFDGTETKLNQRDPNPATNNTIISGKQADPNNDAFHVVTATGGYSVLDGFTITGGNARTASGTASRGGGLLITTTDPIEIANCRFLENTALDQGGAVWVTTDASDLTFTNCSFKGNQAAQGGAVWVSEEDRITFANCVFQGNLATDLGGALVARISDSYVTLVNCSFQGNRSGTVGSAIYAESSVTLFNTVVWGNQDGDLAPDASLNQLFRTEGASIVTKYSLVQNVSDLGFGSLVDADPRFFAPVDPSQAPTTEGNLELRSASPLIDRGNNANQTGDFDVSGYSRLENSTIDIGAHEAAEAFVSVPNLHAIPNGASIFNNWIKHGSIENYDQVLTQQETHGDFEVDGGPSLSENESILITLIETNSAFLNYTLSLTPNDNAHAPLHLDFTIKTGTHTLYVDPSAVGGDRSGSSWANAKANLASALEYSDSGDTIYIATGNYRPDDGALYEENNQAATFQLQSGVTLYGGFPAGGSDFANRDFETNETTLDGDNTFHHVVTGSGTDATAILDGFTIRDGEYDTEAANPNGLGLLNIAGSPTITNCVFEGHQNLPWARGAAIANQDGSSPTITHCIFRNNQGVGAGIANLNESHATISDCQFLDNFGESAGGAIYNDNSNPILSNSLFSNNQASAGGAIYNNGANPTVTHCQFQSNTGHSQSGGAIHNDDSNPTFENCDFESNHSGVNGGAFFITGSGTTTLRNCNFIENTAQINGGAIYKIEGAALDISDSQFDSNLVDSGSGGAIYMSAGSATLENVDFLENSSQSGGALYAFFTQLDIEGATFTRNRSYGRAGAIFADQATFDIQSTRFLGNTATSRGGAIDTVESTILLRNSEFVHNRARENSGGALYVDNGSSLTLLNTALVENMAVQGGGIWAEKAVLLTNSILWENSNASGAPSQVEGSGGFEPTSANNIIQGLPGGEDPLFILAPNSVENDLPENTSKIHYGNLRLAENSPAIDAGANPNEPSALDLGGNARIQNSTIDIGPYEGHRENYDYLFGHLSPDGDYNANGLSNYHDYAAGVNPEDPIAFNANPIVSRNLDGIQIYFAQRQGREDIHSRWETSSTLEPDSWRPMAQDEDYTTIITNFSATRRRTLIKPSTPGDSPAFFRQVFSPTP